MPSVPKVLFCVPKSSSCGQHMHGREHAERKNYMSLGLIWNSSLKILLKWEMFLKPVR